MSETETLVFTIVLLMIPIGLFLFFGWFLWTRVFSGGKGRVEARRQRMKDLEQRLANALPSTATVLSSQPVGVDTFIDQHGFGQYRTVSATLNVKRPKGDEAGHFETNVVWDVQVLALPKVAPDAVIEVLVDRDDERNVYPKPDWARATID